MGNQVRGFGFLHDGSLDTLFRFHGALAFVGIPAIGLNPGGIPLGSTGDALRRQIEAFLFAFDSNLAPIVGQQITLTPSNAATAGPRIDLFEARAAAKECDLVVKGRVGGSAAGYLYNRTNRTFGSSQSSASLTDTALRALAQVAGGELTFTCVPPGSGARIAQEN